MRLWTAALHTGHRSLLIPQGSYQTTLFECMRCLGLNPGRSPVPDRGRVLSRGRGFEPGV